MLEVSNVKTYGWDSAIRGMRNPMNSWEKSDSIFYSAPSNSCTDINGKSVDFSGIFDPVAPVPVIGPRDLNLMHRLSEGGPVHGKFLRMIMVSMDIKAPLYWWKEFDTYKVGTVANSCSTMHKIHDKEFTLDDFSNEHLLSYSDMKKYTNDNPEASLENAKNAYCAVVVGSETYPDPEDPWVYPKEMLILTIRSLNAARTKYLETHDKKYWWQMIQLLPSSYNQKRTIMMNYQVAKEIWEYRRNHKLDEWHTLCESIEMLPYANELICINKDGNE